MDKNNELFQLTEFIFNRDYLSELDETNDISEDEEKKYDDVVEKLYEEYDWNDIFKCWFDYLQRKCINAKQALNFAHLFWNYEGHEHYIEDPYKFLSYFYYRIDMKKYRDIAMTILDGISIEVLHRAGITNVYYDENPYYEPENDPMMIREIENWKKQEK